MTNVVSLTGAPTGEREPNQICIEYVEALLEKARSGEVVGVGVVEFHCNGKALDNMAGRVGGAEMVGAAQVMAYRLTKITLGEPLCDDYEDGGA